MVLLLLLLIPGVLQAQDAKTPPLTSLPSRPRRSSPGRRKMQSSNPKRSRMASSI